MKKNYKFCGHLFVINTVFDYFHEFAKDYVSLEKNDNYELISSSIEEIDLWSKENNVDTKIYPKEYIETLLIHSKLADVLSLDNVFLIHGSSIYVNNINNGYIFIAPSGVGKSTHVNILKRIYKDKIIYINDDKPFITIENNKIYLYGSPFDGKERKSNNIKSRLEGIFLLSRSKENKVSKIKGIEAIEFISNQIHFPKGIKQRENTFNFLTNLVKSVPIYDLKVNMKDDASKVSFGIMDKIKL